MRVRLKNINQNTLFIGIAMAFLSQMYLQTNISNLRISLGIVLLPLCYYVKEDIEILNIGVISSVSVYAMRIITYCILTQFQPYEFFYGMKEFFPEMFFYIIYFIIFYFVAVRNKKRKHINFLFIACILSDFIGNMTETIIRYILNSTAISFKEIVGLFVFALLRSLLIWVLLNVIERYTMLLSKKEHEDRYKKLLYTTSELKTELYWMEKSVKSIEDVMANAYNLYYRIDSDTNTHDLKETALNISKDIHEIKKQNMLVLRGLEEILEDKLDDEGMLLSDIFDILNNSLKNYSSEICKDIKLFFKIKENLSTTKHYYIMSVLRNLIMNAMDSVETSGEVSIAQETYNVKEECYHVFTVADNGRGISKENMKFIFSPGFSTKINYETGSINRGLGLSIVKEIVENTFNGFIELYSNENEGAKFIVYIPKKILEG